MPNSEVQVSVKIADLPPFLDLVRTCAVLAGELLDPTFKLDTLTPSAQLALQSMVTTLGKLGAADTTALPGEHHTTKETP